MNQRTRLITTGTVDKIHGTAMGQAFAAATGSNLFSFDLLDTVDDLKSRGFKERLLGKIAFACDAYIGMAIQSALSAMKETQEVEGTANWDSYQAFRAYVAGIAASEETMREAGMEVRDTRSQLQRLYNMRTACHDKIATSRSATPMDAALVGNKRDPLIYPVPNIEAFFRNPRLRRDDLKTSQKKANVNKMLATDLDTGVIDVELLAQLEVSMEATSVHKRQRDLEFDRQRGELTAMLWRAFDLKEYGQPQVYEEAAVHAIRLDDSTVQLDAQEVVSRGMGQTGEVSPIDPFGDLSAETQYKLMHGMLGRNGMPGYIKGTLLDATSDWSVDYEEHAKWTIESRPLVKTIRAELEHSKFANVGV